MAAVEAAVRVVAGLAGVLLVLAAVASSLRTVVLPRGVPARLARAVFAAVRAVFGLRMGRAASYERRDAVMALYAPVALVCLLATWLVLILLGYGLLFGAVNWPAYQPRPFLALEESGSSLFTLGFQKPVSGPASLVAFTEAAVGMAQLALLISYLPTLYSRFARREAAVAKLEVRAGSPPRGATLLIRSGRLDELDQLSAVWANWEDWFIDIEEAHTSQPALAFFRSPDGDKHWVTAAGAILDAASLKCAVLDKPRDTPAELAIRAGYLALRRIAAYYHIPYNPDPRPDAPITISRTEFDEVVEEMADAGLPVREDRDQAWRDFAGWRVNYDSVLVDLATRMMAPYAPWSSDRSVVHWKR
jgi:hypothetical protein